MLLVSKADQITFGRSYLSNPDPVEHRPVGVALALAPTTDFSALCSTADNELSVRNYTNCKTNCSLISSQRIPIRKMYGSSFWNGS